MPEAADDVTPGPGLAGSPYETRTARRMREEAERRARRRSSLRLGRHLTPRAATAPHPPTGPALAVVTAPAPPPETQLATERLDAPTPWSATAGTVLLAVLLGVCALSGQLETGLALALCGLALGWGWPLLLDSPTQALSGLVVGAGAVALPLTVALTVDEDYLRWLPATLGVAMIVGFLQQLLRRDRTDLTRGIAAAVIGLALATSGATMAALPAYRVGGGYVVVAAAGLAGAAVVEVVERVGPLRRVVLLLAAAGGVAGALVAAAVGADVPLLVAAVLGLLTGVVSHIARRILVVLPGAATLPARLGVGAASVLSVGVLVYLVTRVAAA